MWLDGKTLSKNDVSRFMARFVRAGADECWLCTGAAEGHGYVQMRIQGRLTRTNRISYRVFVGPIPDGMFVLHKCDVRRCVNPGHLFLGDREINRQDMITKGRQRGATGTNNYGAKLTEEQVLVIRKRHKQYCPVNGTNALAKEFKVHKCTITRITLLRRWKLV